MLGFLMIIFNLILKVFLTRLGFFSFVLGNILVFFFFLLLIEGKHERESYGFLINAYLLFGTLSHRNLTFFLIPVYQLARDITKLRKAVNLERN